RGAVRPLGAAVTAIWDASLTGTSSARIFATDWKERYGLSVDFACRLVPGALDSLSRPESRKLDPSGQYSMVAAREAWADAGAPEVAPERLGVVVGTGIGGIWT